MHQTNHSAKAINIEEQLRHRIVVDGRPVLGLIDRLCRSLAEEEIAYCHWKSNNALDRSASGENDLDLLISRADASRFAELLLRLGFKQTKAPADKQMTGVLDYHGYDAETCRWVHVHAHYQLVMGHDTTKNFRLAVEGPYLESAVQSDLFKIPTVEFEFVVFVIRMVLKHCTWDALLSREGKLNSRERKELAYLQAHSSQTGVDALLQCHLPYIDIQLLNDCVQSLQPGCAFWTRAKTGNRLQARLEASARHALPVDVFLKLWRRADLSVRRRIFKSTPKYRLQLGGTAIALVGGDGAGKSTAVDGLYAWLSQNFKVTRVHLGKPGWSLTTIVVRSGLKVGQALGLYPLEESFDKTLVQKSLVSPGYPFLLREVCRARDRYWTYVKARRLAANGDIVIFDRFPLDQIQLMDGPQTERFVSRLTAGSQAKGLMIPRKTSRLTNALIKLERNYYQRITLPELLVVFRLDPEIAVQRKPEDDAETVRARSKEIWQVNWKNTNAHIIDAGKSKTEVLAELKALFWSEL